METPEPYPQISQPADGATGDAALPPPQFCNACGAPWVPTWVECVPCAARREQANLAAGAAAALRESNTPVTSAIALYFAILACSIGGSIAINAGVSPVNMEIGFALVSSTVVLIWCAGSLRTVLPALRRVPHVGWFAAAAGGSIVTFAIASAAVFGLHKAIGIPTLRMTDEFFAAGYGIAFVVLLIAVQPGIFEELAFRGVILGGVRHVLSPMEAIVVSAAMFMIIHLAVPSFPHLFVMGLALGWLRVRTGSLYPGMLLHFCHNLLCVVWELWRPVSS